MEEFFIDQVLFEISRNANVAIEGMPQTDGLVGAEMKMKKIGTLMQKTENHTSFKTRLGVTSTTSQLKPNRMYGTV